MPTLPESDAGWSESLHKHAHAHAHITKKVGHSTLRFQTWHHRSSWTKGAECGKMTHAIPLIGWQRNVNVYLEGDPVTSRPGRWTCKLLLCFWKCFTSWHTRTVMWSRKTLEQTLSFKLSSVSTVDNNTNQFDQVPVQVPHSRKQQVWVHHSVERITRYV